MAQPTRALNIQKTKQETSIRAQRSTLGVSETYLQELLNGRLYSFRRTARVSHFTGITQSSRMWVTETEAVYQMYLSPQDDGGSCLGAVSTALSRDGHRNPLVTQSPLLCLLNSIVSV